MLATDQGHKKLLGNHKCNMNVAYITIESIGKHKQTMDYMHTKQEKEVLPYS